MKAHHFVKEVHQKTECFYCKNDLSKHHWESIFHFDHHYKHTTCDNCGKGIDIKMHFHGSGHDCWNSDSGFCKFVGKPAALSLIKGLEEKIK